MKNAIVIGKIGQLFDRLGGVVGAAEAQPKNKVSGF